MRLIADRLPTASTPSPPADYDPRLILIDAVLPRLYDANLRAETALLLGATPHKGEVVCQWASNPDGAAAQLQLAGSERWLGIGDRGAGVLERTRASLFGTAPTGLRPADVARKAASYMQAVGRGNAAELKAHLLDLFRRLPKLPSTFTTAEHYSRLHLAVSEAAVLAATTEDFRPVAEVRHRLGPEETASRQRLLPTLREQIQCWGERDW